MKKIQIALAGIVAMVISQTASADFLCKGYTQDEGQIVVQIDLKTEYDHFYDYDGEAVVSVATEASPLINHQADFERSSLRAGSMYNIQFKQTDNKISIYEFIQHVPVNAGGCTPMSKIMCKYEWVSTFDVNLSLDGEKVELYCQELK